MTNPRMPFFQLYPADFLASGKVAAMTNAEVGAYFLLMCQAWMSDPPCSVPDSDPVLARWARMPLQEWLDARPAVLSAWELREGRWFQPRMESEWGKATKARAAHAYGAEVTNRIKKERSASRSACAQRTPSDPPASRSAHAYSDTRDQITESKTEDHAPTRRKPPVDAEPGWWGSAGGIQFNATERKWRGVAPSDMIAWVETYPAVDVGAEMRKAGEWCLANGAKGRKSNYRKFITGWLSRAQDNGGTKNGAYSNGKPNAESRRIARAGDEFPEHLVLPTS